MVNLSLIKGINSIQQLAEHYDLIRKYCHQINPKMKEQMDDIVQDTFLKLNDLFQKYPGKEIDGGYVAMALSSVYKNYLKAYNNKIDLGCSMYEAYIPENTDESDTEKQIKEDDELMYNQFEAKKSELSWYDQKLLEYSLIMSVSELSRQSKISYKSLSWSLNKIKNKLKDAEDNK